jgi:hypothetical protein
MTLRMKVNSTITANTAVSVTALSRMAHAMMTLIMAIQSIMATRIMTLSTIHLKIMSNGISMLNN